MARPNYPSPDRYVGNTMVPMHFAETPRLLNLPPGCEIRTKVGLDINDDIRRLVTMIFNMHGLKSCPNKGLYYVGSEEWHRYVECEKIIVLVIELMIDQVSRWREIDQDVHRLLRGLQFTGIPQIPMRYYVHPLACLVHLHAHVPVGDDSHAARWSFEQAMLEHEFKWNTHFLLLRNREERRGAGRTTGNRNNRRNGRSSMRSQDRHRTTYPPPYRAITLLEDPSTELSTEDRNDDESHGSLVRFQGRHPITYPPPYPTTIAHDHSRTESHTEDRNDDESDRSSMLFQDRHPPAYPPPAPTVTPRDYQSRLLTPPREPNPSQNHSIPRDNQSRLQTLPREATPSPSLLANIFPRPVAPWAQPTAPRPARNVHFLPETQVIPPTQMSNSQLRALRPEHPRTFQGVEQQTMARQGILRAPAFARVRLTSDELRAIQPDHPRFAEAFEQAIHENVFPTRPEPAQRPNEAVRAPEPDRARLEDLEQRMVQRGFMAAPVRYYPSSLYQRRPDGTMPAVNPDITLD
ncbi:hypothetical protein Q7P37_002061 [Cladosporium fusiforme]